MSQPRVISPETAEMIAFDWDHTATITLAHNDKTATAAFRVCANRIRRAAGLTEVDRQAAPVAATETPTS